MSAHRIIVLLNNNNDNNSIPTSMTFSPTASESPSTGRDHLGEGGKSLWWRLPAENHQTDTTAKSTATNPRSNMTKLLSYFSTKWACFCNCAPPPCCVCGKCTDCISSV